MVVNIELIAPSLKLRYVASLVAELVLSQQERKVWKRVLFIPFYVGVNVDCDLENDCKGY